MTTANDRLNNLIAESTQTAFDAAAQMQRQNATLLQSWMTVVEAGQEATRQYTLKTLEHAREAQNIWRELVQETLWTTGQTVAQSVEANGRATKKAEAAAR